MLRRALIIDFDRSCSALPSPRAPRAIGLLTRSAILRSSAAGSQGRLCRTWRGCGGVFATWPSPSFSTRWLGLLAGAATLALAVWTWRGGATPMAAMGPAATAPNGNDLLHHARVLEALGMTQQHASAITTPPVTAAGFVPPSVSPPLVVVLFIALAGATFVLLGQLSLGVLAGVLVLVVMALAPISGLAPAWRAWREAVAARSRILRLLETMPARFGHAIAGTLRGALSVDDLSHTSPDGTSLKAISFALAPGRVLLVTGGTDRVRAVLADLLLGLRRPDSGSVRIDGHDVCEQDRTVLGPRIGFVPAVGDLLDGSIRENIARFAPAPLERIGEAAEQAAVNAAIEALPEGYDTRVGRSGRELPPDLTWLIGLARAAFDTPSFIVIEEPEVALDEAQRLVVERAMGRLQSGGSALVLFSAGPEPAVATDVLRLEADGSASYRAAELPLSLPAVEPVRPATAAAAGTSVKDPRIHTLEQVLARIRDNVTTQPEVRLPTTVPADTSRPPREASLTAEPAGAGPVLHINPEWLARQVGRTAR